MSRFFKHAMQQNFSSENTAGIGIGGIKVSPEMVLFKVFRLSCEESDGTTLLRHMTDAGIALSFLIRNSSGSDTVYSFCVSRNDAVQVKRLLTEAEFDNHRVESTESAAAVSIFPHKYSFAMLGAAIKALGKAGIPVHALCTSLSAVVVITNFELTDQVVLELLKMFDLPCNHAPFYTDFEPNPDNR